MMASIGGQQVMVIESGGSERIPDTNDNGNSMIQHDLVDSTAKRYTDQQSPPLRFMPAASLDPYLLAERAAG